MMPNQDILTRERVMKTAKPILFNTEMVRAIQDGRKTVTRRVAFPNTDLHEFRCKKYPNGWWFRGSVAKDWESICNFIKTICPCKYKVGDLLYMRETWCKGRWRGEEEKYYYRADNLVPHCEWHPSIHMPKEAARIFLRVTGVRVERLQDIDDDGVIAEGLEIGAFFDELWNSTVKKSDIDKYGWAANPWVWVIEFERLEVK